MASSVGHLTQSRYYSPAFNAAVFDGPIRIYFAQHQEALALKVYFRLQQHLKSSYQNVRRSFKQHGQTVFLMLYPTTEMFGEAFGAADSAPIVSDRLGLDHVIGVCGPQPDEDYADVFLRIEAILRDLGAPLEPPAPSL